ncbi:44020_t:CDS:2, partial [Gigaspora margarita]
KRTSAQLLLLNIGINVKKLMTTLIVPLLVSIPLIHFHSYYNYGRAGRGGGTLIFDHNHETLNNNDKPEMP